MQLSTKRADELKIVGDYHRDPRHSAFSAFCCTFYSCPQAAGIELSISFAMLMCLLPSSGHPS